MIMDKKKINIAIEQLQKVHRDMNDCANRFILKDAIDQLQEQVKNCSIPDVSQRSELLPEFLMKDLDGKIITAYVGGADVTKEWKEYLGNCG